MEIGYIVVMILGIMVLIGGMFFAEPSGGGFISIVGVIIILSAFIASAMYDLDGTQLKYSVYNNLSIYINDIEDVTYENCKEAMEEVEDETSVRDVDISINDRKDMAVIEIEIKRSYLFFFSGEYKYKFAVKNVKEKAEKEEKEKEEKEEKKVSISSID